MARRPAAAPLASHWALATLAGLAWLACAGPAGAAPRALPARAEIEAAADPARMRFVWGTRDPALAPLLRERASAIARRMFGADSSQVLADRDAHDADLAGGAVVLLGGPRQNLWAERLAPALPVDFTPVGFRWRGTPYERPGDLLVLAYPNPRAGRSLLFIVAPNSAAALGRHGGFLLGADDWRIVREGEVVRSGSFSQAPASPWAYDPALDHDREAERARWQGSLASRAGGGVVVRAPADLAIAAPTFTAARALLARMDAMGLGAPAARPVALTLYRSIEEMGRIARDTRPEHVSDDGGAHAALAAGRGALDLGCVASARLAVLGGAPRSRFAGPAGAWLAGRLDGESLERAVARVYFGRLLPSATDAAARPDRWRSPLVTGPARALVARAVWESAPAARRRAALLALLRADAPGTLDSLGALTGVPGARIAARYRALADSLAFAGRRERAVRQLVPWRPADGFMAGACLAHDVRLDRGYASGACARTLRTLRDAGAGWVSLTPFGYVPEGGDDLWPSAGGGPDEETDEAVCEAAGRAHALGLRVWLVPHLWSRSWPGALQLTSADWSRFLDRYREFALHYALLADRERIEGFAIGHEMASSTARDPQFWRGLAASAREAYGGTLTYVANWDEAGRVPFWDALDLVAVSFYAPLAASPTHDPGVLRAGAARAVDALAPLARRAERTVLLAEVGYASVADAPVHPWQEGGGPPDPATQRDCYDAIASALAGRDWIAGTLWWKWPSGGEGGGPGDRSYTPLGKPAEARARLGWNADRARVVRAPVAR